MRGVYTVEAQIATLTVGRTLLLLEAPSDLVIELLSVEIGNATNATAEQLEFAIGKVATKGSPVGTSATPKPMETGDQASSVTATVNLTTDVSAWDAKNYHRKGVSNLVGYTWRSLEDQRFYVSPSGLAGVRLLTAPASTTFTVFCTFREIGG